MKFIFCLRLIFIIHVCTSLFFESTQLKYKIQSTYIITKIYNYLKILLRQSELEEQLRYHLPTQIAK